MTSIATTLGAGSGIDTAALVTSLVSAAFDPKDAALKTKETANTAKISSLATLSNGIDSFASALSSLISGGSLRTQPSSSNAAILTATAKAGASIGTLSAQVEVRQLAQAQSLVSAPVASSAGNVGQGSFTIAVGATTKTVTIDATNDSLAGLARAINATGAGVTAGVITDASGARLTLKGTTGAANAFTLTPAAGADPGLARFAYGNGQTGGMTQAQAAQDAIVRMDGVDVTRPANTIDDLVDGVSLSLVSAQPGTTVSLGATRPTAAIGQAVTDFVDAYNELKGEIDTATQSATTSSDGTSGALYGNATIRDMQRQLARLTSTVLASGGAYRTLAEIGVQTNRDGTLTVNTAQLNGALAANPDAVEALFNPTQHSSSPLVKITSAFGATKPGTYQLANIVAANGATNASGTIAGAAAITTGTKLYAASTSPAAGLVIEPQGDVASATVTVDLGLGGALQAIRDSLRATNGALATLSTQLTTEKSDLASQRTKLTTDQGDYKTRLTNQYATMETRVSALKATQSYLTQQIAAWNKSDS